MDSDPEKLFSITSYLKEQEQDEVHVTNTDELETVEEDDENKDVVSNIDDQSQSASIAVSETLGDLTDLSDADSVPFGGLAKRAKYDSTSDGGADKASSLDAADNQKMNNETINIRKKVRRKKTAAKHHKLQVEENVENLINTVRITTKLEWKRLRNKYLNHQREQIKELKKQLWADRKPKTKAVAPVQQKDKKIIQNTRNINFYGAIKETKDDEDMSEVPPINKLLDKKPLFSYEPGIIVKIHFDEPCVDVKDFKMEMRQHPFVKYVDVKEGDIAAFVRVEASKYSTTLIKHCARKCQILTGSVEEAYWEKIHTDRQQKLTKTLKIKPKRGREKINKMLASHVRFDD